MTLLSRSSRIASTALGAAALLATLAACGGGSSGSSDAISPASQGSSAASGPAAKVTVHSGPLGRYLTDGSGRTLYLFAADTSSMSTCKGACTQEWPPFTTSGSPKASGGAKASMLSTSTRSDGTTQVTYAGHPLYYFTGDSGMGDMNGEGLNDFGGKWDAVSPAGAALPPKTGSSGGGSSSSPTQPSNGWG